MEYWYNESGARERQILAEPRQGLAAATVGEFLWVFPGTSSLALSPHLVGWHQKQPAIVPGASLPVDLLVY